MNQQIIALRNQDYSYEQIADALGMDVDQVRFVIEESGKEVDLNKLDKELALQAKLALMSIFYDKSAERSERIAAARVVLSGKGEVPDINAAGLEERFGKMKQITAIIKDAPTGESEGMNQHNKNNKGAENNKIINIDDSL